MGHQHWNVFIYIGKLFSLADRRLDFLPTRHHFLVVKLPFPSLKVANFCVKKVALQSNDIWKKEYR